MPARSLDAIPSRFDDAPSFWGFIGEIEREQLDFKVRADGLKDTVPAMAMTDGGLIVLGIRNEPRELVGCPLSQDVLDRVTTVGADVGVDVVLKAVTVGDVDLTIVVVPEVRGRLVTTPDGRVLRRVGSSSRPVVGDALARFVLARVEHIVEDDAVPLQNTDDIDLALVNRALEAAGKARVRRDTVVRALMDLGVARPELPPTGPVITKAAILLFGKDPRRLIPGAAVQVVRRAGVGPGPGPTTVREEFAGPMPAVVEGVLAFLARHGSFVQVVTGARRERIPVFPTEVLREAVLNAVAHRDYGIAGTTVDITIWDDRIEIRSPGSLPGPITVENIREQHYSRNRRIMNVLKILGYVEEYGEGMPRIFDAMEARLMRPPVIVANAVSVTLTMYAGSFLTAEDQAWLALLGHLSLTPAERRLLVSARREGWITPRKLRAEMPGENVDVLLAGGVAKGLLRQEGERGGSRYVLSAEVLLRAGASGLEARGRQRQMLLDEIRRRGSISTVEGTDLLGEQVPIVRHLLNDLVRAQLIVAAGKTRGRRYYLPELAPRI
ncbi:MAG TPA: ATP-binding protein [Candidatus Limnocylindrales bacterium]|nr:ATP-binding protein [Candidatus Limnocylindrales bacterium]